MIPLADHDEHVKICDYVEIYCQDCQTMILRSDLDRHVDVCKLTNKISIQDKLINELQKRLITEEEKSKQISFLLAEEKEKNEEITKRLNTAYQDTHAYKLKYVEQLERVSKYDDENTSLGPYKLR